MATSHHGFRAILGALVFSLSLASCTGSESSSGSAESNASGRRAPTRFLTARELAKASLRSLQETNAALAGEVIVKFRDGVSKSEQQSISGSHGQVLTSLDVVPRNGAASMAVVSVPEKETEAALAKLKRNPYVQYAEPNYILTRTLTPNDSFFTTDQLYGLHNTGAGGGTAGADIDAVRAWDSFTGITSKVIAVIDTGVDYNHPDLAANIWTNPNEIAGNNIDDDNNGYIDDIHGINAITNTGDPMDDESHGTHVAGTIGAVGNNSIGVVGVNWNARIAACKFLDSMGSGLLSDAVKCLNYFFALRTAGIPVVITNNSWGGGGYSQALVDALSLRNAQTPRTLHVIAAGNANNNNDNTPTFPASYSLPNTIAVAATDSRDEYAFFTNYGRTSVDLAAPGVGIVSTIPGGSYASFSGTSMAAPHVAGAALMLYNLNANLSAESAIAVLKRTVDPISATGIKRTITDGRLNLKNALDSYETVAPATVTLTVTSQSLSIGLRWTAPGDNGNTGTATSYQLRYSTSPINTVAEFNAATQFDIPAPKAAGQIETAKVTGLQRSTTYYFALATVDEWGNRSEISEDVTATTKAGVVIFRNNAEGGAGTTPFASMTGLWHDSTRRFSDPTRSFYYGQESTGNYDTGAVTTGALTTPQLDLNSAAEALVSYKQFAEGEDYDLKLVQVSSNNGSSWTTRAIATDTNGQWQSKEVDLGASLGQTRVRFFFDSQDPFFNFFEGWYVDEVVVIATFAPLAANGNVSTDEDTPKGVTLSASDRDGDPVTYTVLTNPQHGTLSGTAPNLTYTPSANYHGSDQFTFRAMDNGGLQSGVATISITVNPVNDTPIGSNISVDLDKEAAISVVLPGSDAEGDTISYTIVTAPQHGSLSGTAPALSYRSNGSAFRGDSFRYQLSDGSSQSPLYTVTIVDKVAPRITEYSVNPSGSGAEVKLTTSEPTTIVVTYGPSPDGRVESSTAAETHTLSFPRVSAGTVNLRAVATDLAGNASTVTSSVAVSGGGALQLFGPGGQLAGVVPFSGQATGSGCVAVHYGETRVENVISWLMSWMILLCLLASIGWKKAYLVVRAARKVGAFGNRLALRGLLCFWLMVAPSIRAETRDARLATKPRQVASQSLPSNASEIRATRSAMLKKMDEPTRVRVDLLTGYSRAGGETSLQDVKSGVSPYGNVQLGLRGDFRTMTYLGGELDAHFGLPASEETSQNGASITKKRSVRGGGAAIKGQLPLWLGTLRFIPKLGAGYDLGFLKEESSDSASLSSSTSVRGPLAMIGLDVVQGRIGLHFDYARTIGAGGSIDVNGDSRSLGDALSSRIRIGASLRILPGICLGAEYTRRSYRFGFDLGTNGSSLPASVDMSQNQFLGLLQIEL